MTGIHIAALLTTAIAVALCGTWIRKLRMPANGRALLLAAAIALPLQPLAFYLLRLPLDHWLAAQLGAGSTAHRWLTSLYAPLTEEPAKLLPLLVPFILRDVRPENFVRYALAIGLGFAIGEMWFIADRLARVPSIAALPFSMLGGYIVERLMTCVCHAAFLAVALSRLRRGLLLGLAGAMALHWLGNFPILLTAWLTPPLPPATRMVILQIWLLLYFLAALGLLAFLALGRVAPGRLLIGQSHCPGCDRDYDAPILGLNFVTFRYERCPHCRRWHRIRTHKR